MSKIAETTLGAVELIVLDLIRHTLDSVTDEMTVTIVRTAHSGVVKDVMDFSIAICDASGRMIAQGLSLPLHLGSIPHAIGIMLSKYRDDLFPGDVLVMNDPYDGGMHLPDVFMYQPAFTQSGELIGFAVAVVHQTDI